MPDPVPAAGAAPAGSTTPPAAPPAPQGAGAPPAQPPQDPSKAAQPPETPKEQPKPAAAAELAIKLPEGKKADQKFLDGYVATAKKLGLSQEQAQGIADHFIAIESEQAKQWDGALKALTAKNDADLKADKDWGGAKYDATVKAADSALKQFFSEEGAKELAELGLQNRPWLRKGLALVRSLVSEDSVGDKKVAPAAGQETRLDQLKKMFPNSPQMFDPNAPLIPAGTPPA
jgi:hypothetical protein